MFKINVCLGWSIYFQFHFTHCFAKARDLDVFLAKFTYLTTFCAGFCPSRLCLLLVHSLLNSCRDVFGRKIWGDIIVTTDPFNIICMPELPNTKKDLIGLKKHSCEKSYKHLFVIFVWISKIAKFLIVTSKKLCCPIIKFTVWDSQGARHKQ